MNDDDYGKLRHSAMAYAVESVRRAGHSTGYVAMAFEVKDGQATMYGKMGDKEWFDALVNGPDDDDEEDTPIVVEGE